MVFVFSNLATSIDGKIATATREHFPLGTPKDREEMIALRRRSEAILMGASTLRSYQKPLLVSKENLQPLNVILTSELEGLSPDWPFFKSDRIKRLLFVSDQIDRAKLEPFQSSCEFEFINSSGGPIAKQVIDGLERRRIKSLLVEGGGNIMWLFAEHDLIDEYHVTVTPRVLGGTEAPTLVDGRGFSADDVVNLKLNECRVVGHEVFLVYSKTGSRGRVLPE